MNWEDSDFAQFALEKVGNTTEYALAWSVYAACILVLLLVFMGWTRWIKWVYLKNMLRFAIVGAVAVPIAHPTEPQFYIPPIIVATVGYLLEGYEYAAPSIRMLGVGAIVGALSGALMALLEVQLTRVWRHYFPAKTAVQSAAGTTEGDDLATEESALTTSEADDERDKKEPTLDNGKVEPEDQTVSTELQDNADKATSEAAEDPHRGPIKPTLPGAAT